MKTALRPKLALADILARHLGQHAGRQARRVGQARGYPGYPLAGRGSTSAGPPINGFGGPALASSLVPPWPAHNRRMRQEIQGRVCVIIFTLSGATDGRLRPFSALAGGRPGIYAGSLSVATIPSFLVRASVSPVYRAPPCVIGPSRLRLSAPANPASCPPRDGPWEPRSKRRPVNGPDSMGRNQVTILSATRPGINAGPITNNGRKRPCACLEQYRHNGAPCRTDYCAHARPTLRGWCLPESCKAI